jgi:hypothetical protein
MSMLAHKVVNAHKKKVSAPRRNRASPPLLRAGSFARLRMFSVGVGRPNTTHTPHRAYASQEENAQIGTSRYLIHPSNEYHSIFDLCVALLIIATVFTMPVCIGWQEIEDSMADFNLMIDICFLIDIVKNFNTGFINQDDVVVMDRPSVIKNYVKGWFLIDLMSSIPIERINNDSELASANSSLKGLKLLRIAKVSFARGGGRQRFAVGGGSVSQCLSCSCEKLTPLSLPP